MKIFFIIIDVIIVGNLFAQENNLNRYYVDYYNEIVVFKNNNIEFSEWGGGNEKKGEFTFFKEYNVPFINVNYQNNLNEKYLVLSNEHICFIYDKTGKRIFRGAHGGYSGDSWMWATRSEFVWDGPETVTVSSFLRKGNILYIAENVGKNDLIGYPWVEGVNGNGINENLLLRRKDAKYLYISIGFVSYEKPYLYEQNSRPKRIRLSVESKFSIEIELEDTPSFQTIILPERLNEDILKLEIIDVFPGTKYEDTCINAILFETSRRDDFHLIK